MRRFGLWLIALTLLTFTGACSSISSVFAPSAPMNVSGRWSGRWTALERDISRSGPVVADLTQTGSRGSGKLVVHDSVASDEVPVVLRQAGSLGVPVVLRASGSDLLVRHERGGGLFTAEFHVHGDQMIGRVRGTSAPVRLILSRGPMRPGENPDSSLPAGSQAKTSVSDLMSQVAEVRSLAESANSAAQEASALAKQASSTAAESEAKANQALAKAGQTDNGASPLWHTLGQLVGSTDVTFAFDRWDLDDAAQTAIHDVVNQLKEHPGFMVALEGYTDSVGTRNYNFQLSQRRAMRVLAYLAEKGVELARIHWVGLGIVSGPDTPEAQAKKRRVTLSLMSGPPTAANTAVATPPTEPAQQ